MEAEGGLLERGDVLASAGRLVGGVASGRAGALFVLAEAGLGKTSVVDQACRAAAAAGLMVGLGRGHPMETSLPFGVLAQALDGVGGRGLLGEDRPGSASPGDQAARFYRVLRWLQDQAGSALLLAFDDMHWADADSLALVSFLCRRMGAQRLGLIATLRPWPPQAREAVAGLAHEGCGSIKQLAPLSEAAAASLLETRLGRPLAPTAHRAFALCAGNPLLLEQLGGALGEGGDLPEAAEPGKAALGARGCCWPGCWPACARHVLRPGGVGAGHQFPARDCRPGRRAGGRRRRNGTGGAGPYRADRAACGR